MIRCAMHLSVVSPIRRRLTMHRTVAGFFYSRKRTNDQIRRSFRELRNSQTYLWAALWSPHRWFCEGGAPELGCPRSSSVRSCYHRWLCRRPGSSERHRHCGAHRSSDDPAGQPGAGCRPVFVSAANSTTKHTKHLPWWSLRGTMHRNRWATIGNCISTKWPRLTRWNGLWMHLLHISSTSKWQFE